VDLQRLDPGGVILNAEQLLEVRLELAPVVHRLRLAHNPASREQAGALTGGRVYSKVARPQYLE
jgi:hypothetical protein